MRNFVRQLTSLRNALAPRLTLAALLPLLAASASAQLLAASPDALAAGPHTFAGHTPHMVAEGQALFVEHYDSTKMLRLTLSLNLPHPAEESQFLEDVQNKKSPLFHQYLTPEQWDARFAPSAQDEQAVVDWATSQGLTINARFPDRLLVEVEGPAGVIETAFHVVLNTYQLPSEEIGLPGEIGFSNDRDPVLPSYLNRVVLSVMGLNSFERVRPASFHNSPKPPDYTPGPTKGEPESAGADAEPQSAQIASQAATPDAGSGTNGTSPTENNGYYPKDVWSEGAYDTDALMRQGHCCNPTNNPNNSPEQTSIAIAAYGDVSFSDVAGYQKGFPNLSYNITKIPIDGGYTCVNTATASDDNCGEVTLDTEWSLTMANSQGSSAKTSKVYVYEGHSYEGSVATEYNQMATDNYARVTTTSWGCEELTCWAKDDMNTIDGIFAKLVGQGWTIMAASGDEGSTAGCGSSLAVQFPSSDPNVIGVGGTTLYLYYDQDQFDSEIDWVGNQTQDAPMKPGSCRKNNGGSTGGFSAVFPTPSYQANMGLGMRAVPDISLNANYGQNYYFLGNWGGVGGTSMSAPEVAGFFAQANSYLLSLGNVCNGKACGTLGNANYAMYDLGKREPTAHVPFYDITSGCSTNDKTTEYHLTAYCAKKGFDETTGWGTFNMLQMAWDLNWETATANGYPSTSWSGPATNKWYNSNQNVSWTIKDNIGSNGGQGTGIAGFTQGWDSISPDSTTQPHGSLNLAPDGFYDGPQFTNGTTGCLALASGEGCSGGVTQGCHTAHVRGWNNMGLTTGDTTYGPVCYDTVAPTITLTSNPDLYASVWWAKGSSITLAATDPGGSGASGIAATYYSVDNTLCSTANTQFCNTYTSAFNVSSQGAHVITYFTKDNAGNFSSVGTFDLWIDLTPPVTSIGFSGNLVVNYWNTAVTAKLTATDAGGSGLKNTLYSVDGGVFNRYDSPFTVSTPGLHTIKYYSDDNAGNVEATNTTSFTIESPTTTTFTASPTTSTPGTTVTMKATLAATLGGTPTGSIAFHNGTTVLGTVALSGNAASFTTTTLPVGNNVLYAVYTGATYYVSSTSVPVTASVTSPTTTTLTSSLNPAKFGQVVTFNATVKATAGAVPTGAVTFKDGTTTLGTASLSSTGIASLMASSLSVASHTITAVYAGNGADLTSTSAALTEVVSAATTTTKLTTDLNPAKFGYTVLLNATVSASTGATPSGQIAFKDGTTTLATLTVNAAGVATYAPSNLAVGSHSITAVYVGDTDDATSTSTVLTQTISAASTTTTVTSSLNPAPFGSTVTFKATVVAGSGTTPTGTVTFKNGTTVLGTATLASGSGSLVVSTLTPGSHSITAIFTADTDDATSTSAALSQSITAATTSTTLKSSAVSAKFGAPVTFTATVKATTGTVPTGTVTFKDTVAGVTRTLGTGTLTSGVATFTTSTLAVEAHSITAIYAADTDDATSTSAAVTQTITAASTSTTLSSTLAAPAFGTPVTFTATVKAATGTTPTGTVTFEDGTKTLGTVTLSTTGIATYETSTLAVGAHIITVVYKGTASDATSTSSAVTVTVH